MWRKLISTPDDGLLAFLRLALFAVFLPHGTQKALGWFGGGGIGGTISMFSGMGIPAFLSYLAIAAEFLGSICLLFGFLSRVAAFGLGCNMVVAVALVHWRNGFFMNWTGSQPGEGFEFHLLALTVLFAVLVRGGGAWSVDRRLWLRAETKAMREIGLRRSA